MLLGLFVFTHLSCVAPVLQLGKLPGDSRCLAVLPFEVRLDVASSDEVLSEFLALDLHRMGARGVLGPTELDQLFIRARDPLPQLLDFSKVRVIGRKLAVDAVVFGLISRLPMFRSRITRREEIQFTINAYLLDVRSGEIQWTFGVQENVDAEAFTSSMSKYSELMAGSLLGWRRGPFGERNCWKAPSPLIKVAAATPAPAPVATAAAPVETELSPQQQAVLDEIGTKSGFVMDATVFELRTDLLAKNAIPILRKVGAALKSSKAPKRTQIAAHVDATADTAEDLKLSMKRAEAVRKHLIDLGVPGERLEAVGYGGMQPQVPNITQRSRERNRRTILISADPPPQK